MLNVNVKVRIEEHRGLSFRTGLPLSSPLHSSIRNHTFNNNNCSISHDDFNVIATGNTEMELYTKESILIKQQRPTLNDMNSILLRVF